MKQARRQEGIVLFMSLILLIIISLVAAIAIRDSISSEQVSKALRAQTVAFQSAESALRFCEDRLFKTGKITSGSATLDPVPASIDGSAPALWRDRANWASGNFITLDAGDTDSTDASARKTSNRPRCMAEAQWLPSESGRRAAYLVTAVGYSPDFRLTGSNKPDTGSEVWLQSTVMPMP